MSRNKIPEKTRNDQNQGLLGMGVGVDIGVVLGGALDALALRMGIGIALGAGIGTVSTPKQGGAKDKTEDR